MQNTKTNYAGLKIEAIIFDLGRVLIDVMPERGIFGMVASGQSQCGADLLQAVMSDPAIRQHNAGLIESHDFFLHINSLLKLNLSFDEFKVRWCNIFDPIPEMAELLSQIKSGIKLGLLSDTDPIHWNFIKNEYHYLDIFTRPALSFDLGCCKPDPKTYLTACELINANPTRTLFIDDLQKNVDGAIHAGLNAFRHISPALTRNKLAELNLL